MTTNTEALLRGASRENDAHDEAKAERYCDMGVGCGEYGACYAAANGEPERCSRATHPAPTQPDHFPDAGKMMKPDLSGFDAFDVLKQGRQARATQPVQANGRYTVEPHGTGWAIYVGRDMSHHGANIGHLTETTKEVAALIGRVLNTAEQAKGGEPMTPEQRGVAAEYWGSLAQQKADLDTRRGVSMPVSYYASDVVAAALAHYATPATAASVSDAVAIVRERYRATKWGKAAECICDAVDEAILALRPQASPDGRGTDAQILKEREIARHAIDGAIAAGYAGATHPGADHWLAAAHNAGMRIAELERALRPAQTGDQWREAVEEQCAINHIDMPEDPREAIKKLIATEVRDALDPSISSAAAALVQAGVQPGWIKASDRVPLEADGEVFVRFTDGSVGTAWATYWHGASNGFAQWSHPDPEEDRTVAYWMKAPGITADSGEVQS